MVLVALRRLYDDLDMDCQGHDNSLLSSSDLFPKIIGIFFVCFLVSPNIIMCPYFREKKQNEEYLFHLNGTSFEPTDPTKLSKPRVGT